MNQRWAVILMDGSPKPEPHAAWCVEGSEQMAEDFRQFVSAEVDPAVKIRLMDPVGELLTWREAALDDGYQAGEVKKRAAADGRSLRFLIDDALEEWRDESLSAGLPPHIFIYLWDDNLRKDLAKHIIAKLQGKISPKAAQPGG